MLDGRLCQNDVGYLCMQLFQVLFTTCAHVWNRSLYRLVCDDALDGGPQGKSHP
jgi:hypothetical protein